RPIPGGEDQSRIEAERQHVQKADGANAAEFAPDAPPQPPPGFVDLDDAAQLREGRKPPRHAEPVDRLVVVTDQQRPHQPPRRYTKIAGCSGRGPTMFISPRSTLKSWGSSSSRNFRSTRPRGVTRASSGWAQTSWSSWPRSSGATCIVRNLNMVNGLPPRSRRRRVLPPARDRARRSSPIRACLKSTGP